MNRVLIIGRSYHPDGKETGRQIADALRPLLKNKGTEVVFCELKNLLFDIDKDKTIILAGENDVKSFDAIFMTNWFSHASVRKDIAHSVALYADYHSVPIMNTESLHTRSTSKLSQLVKAALNGVPIARSIYSLNFHKTIEYVISSGMQFPLIVKDVSASRGKSNYLTSSIQEIEKLAKLHNEKHSFVVQSFIKSDGRDYRYFVAGGRTRLVIERRGQDGGHLNNTSAGGRASLVVLDSVPKEIQSVVDRLSELFHREVTGIDIMFDENGKYYFLEANPIPQIATGSFVDEKLKALADALAEASQRRGK